MPSRGGATQGMSTRSRGLPVTPSRGGSIHGILTRSGGAPVAPSRGGSTQGMSTRAGGQPVTTSGGAIQGRSTCSGGQPVLPTLQGTPQDSSTLWGVLTEKKCRGCDYDKSSLRGHLARTTKNCKNLYSQVELDDLKDQAEAIHKEKKAQWKREYGHKSVDEKTHDDIVCEECNKTFATQFTYGRHISEIHKRSVYRYVPCPKCPKFFPRKENLKDHLAAAHNEHGPMNIYNECIGIKCDHCEMIFQTIRNLQRHVAEQHRADKIACNLCFKEFSRKENLNRHIYEVHEEWVTWKCDQCPLKVARWATLERHLEEVHDKEKKYKCPICENAFDRNENMERHLSEVHKGEKPFTCPKCKINFALHHHLKRHIYEVHKKDKEWGCDRCPAEFSRLENLERHENNESAHWKWWEECQFCHDDDLWFKSETEARKHFLFTARSRANDKRSDTAYSCVVREKELKQKREEYRKKLVEEALERSERWRRKWRDMPEEWKEKEKRLLREEKIEEMRCKISQVFQYKSEEFKEARLREQTEKIDNDTSINYVFHDEWMADLMRKKYGPGFLNYVSGELSDIRKVKKMKPLPPFSGNRPTKQSTPKEPQEKSPEKDGSPTGWMCNLCDPEPEFATSQELMKHVEIFHPELSDWVTLNPFTKKLY